VLTLNSTSDKSQSILNFQFVGVQSYSAGNTLAKVSIPSGLTVPPHIVQTAQRGNTCNSMLHSACLAIASFAIVGRYNFTADINLLEAIYSDSLH